MTQALDLKLSNDQNLEEFLQVTVETRRKTQLFTMLANYPEL